jgi:hypothetical protein
MIDARCEIDGVKTWGAASTDPPISRQNLGMRDVQDGRIWHLSVITNDMMSLYMGRSFDRGGRNRKEREHGKRRAFQQAEREKEARHAVMQARRAKPAAEMSVKRQPVFTAPLAPVEIAQPPAPDIPVIVVAQKKPGFMSQFFKRIFKKSA